MKVSVVMAFEDSQQVVQFLVEEACTARGAVNQAVQLGLKTSSGDFDVDAAPLGIYGLRVPDDEVLKEGDRVEIYRQLQQDPMELRRKRAASEVSRLSARRK